MEFTTTIALPDQIAAQLHLHQESFSQQLLEGYVVEKYRSGYLTEFQVGEILNHESRWETHAFLKKHHCHGYTEDDFEKDGKTLEALFQEAKT